MSAAAIWLLPQAEHDVMKHPEEEWARGLLAESLRSCFSFEFKSAKRSANEVRAMNVYQELKDTEKGCLKLRSWA